ncbi:MAG: putative NeuB family protein [Prokaryotic dsDNA virus sp.]|nr:MAG: putative NeuB family protein [Prokaryotic dsDNA virus sp.]|tara:strand:- start:3960 stop:4709 length:750 start_codon:yes stop_codon:yes gene_type:complete
MIVAEIGLNHMGCEKYLMDYVKHLIDSPVDAITLQIREEKFYKNTNFGDLTLEQSVYDKVHKIVSSNKKKFGIAISDLSYLSYFNDKVDFYKVLSKDLNNDEIMNKLINQVDKPIFVSTGLSSCDEINLFINKIKVDKKKNISLIHTRLSNRVEDTNLKAIEKMKKQFKLPVAFGNHCENPMVTYAALAFEPSAIFLYIKGNKTIQHPDNNHAILLKDIREYSTNIKQIVKSIGNGHKEITHNSIKGQI